MDKKNLFGLVGSEGGMIFNKGYGIQRESVFDVVRTLNQQRVRSYLVCLRPVNLNKRMQLNLFRR